MSVRAWELGFHVSMHVLSFRGPVAVATVPSTIYGATRLSDGGQRCREYIFCSLVAAIPSPRPLLSAFLLLDPFHFNVRC